MKIRELLLSLILFFFRFAIGLRKTHTSCHHGVELSLIVWTLDFFLKILKVNYYNYQLFTKFSKYSYIIYYLNNTISTILYTHFLIVAVQDGSCHPLTLKKLIFLLPLLIFFYRFIKGNIFH